MKILTPTQTVQQRQLAQEPRKTIGDAAFLDKRESAVTQRKLQKMIDGSPHTMQLKAAQEMMGHIAYALPVKDEAPLQGKFSSATAAQLAPQSAAKQNNTGLPNQLKAGIESLSGMALDHVKVHYNSAQPAQLNAHAYAQGSEIHLAPGQERHLPHEAWHVVQQAQGRVKPTMQMKGGVPVNDDADLEQEADAMGAQALHGSHEHASLASPMQKKAQFPRFAGQPGIVQRFTVVDNHRVANDHTAAVKIEVNNKMLYATQGKITASNAVLRDKSIPISMVAGAQKDGLVDDQVLLAVTPRFEANRNASNYLEPGVSPQASVTHGVLLPSECEKGAIAVIGAYTKTSRSPGNTRIYDDKDHSNARIGELLAQSTAGGGQKNTWYADWCALEVGADKALHAHNTHTYAAAEMAALFHALNDAELLQEFVQNFTRTADRTAFTPNYIFSEREKSITLFKKIISKFDEKMAAIETAIMATVDTGTVGEQQDLVGAINLQTQLRTFFTNQDYDKAAIDQAIAMVPEALVLQASLNELFRQNQAGNKYESQIWFREQARLQGFAAAVLAAISKRITALTIRNTKSLAHGSGLNTEVNPEIGQSYGILGGNYALDEGGRWNWHWAAVIMKTATDNVTMEAHRSHRIGTETHNDRWDFKMYGTLVNSNQTFHDEWKSQGFGRAPVTVLGVARTLPNQIAMVRNYGLDTLDRATTETAILATNELLDFTEVLKNGAKTKVELIGHYQAGRDAALVAIGQIPAPYIAANIQGDWDTMVAAITDLINDVGTPDEQMNRSIDVNDAALDVYTEMLRFYRIAMHHRGHLRKRGL